VTWRPSNATYVDSLARTIAEVEPNVKDYLEVAVILEIVGVSDETARLHGYESVFALARDVEPLVELYRPRTSPARGGPLEQRSAFILFFTGMFYNLWWVIMLVALFLGGQSLWASVRLPPDIATSIGLGVILGLVATGFVAFGGERVTLHPLFDRPPSPDLALAFGAALVPVLFAYGGWQTSGFVMGELKRPGRDMPRALLLGVAGVVVLYLAVNLVCLRALGAQGLAASRAPATDVMRAALGERGARLIALGIVISTLGFLAQGILTAPRVYYAMARDGVFFRAVGELHPRTRVPVLAIALQGLVAGLIAVSGRYEQILNYVVSVDFIAMGLTGAALFVFRSRGERGAFRAPGHPWTTAFFVLSCWLVVAATIHRYPQDSVKGLAILALGLPVYWLWSSRGGQAARGPRPVADGPRRPLV